MTMHRVLDRAPVLTLQEYLDAGGGIGLAEAAQATSADVIDTLLDSGLRGRGGAGFPTGRKWDTIANHESAALPTAVVVNAAEGEPGSFKDRMLIRTNPYRVLEGALIAAVTVGARDVVVAAKASFQTEIDRLRGAIDEIRAAGWIDEVQVEVFEGPDHYLYGEETGLLEALDGRPPFPRIAPPWRHGIVEIATSDDPDQSSGSTADLQLGGTSSTTSPVPPALVNNVETLCHVTTILANGPTWFRDIGTSDSPGSIVCTVTGSTRRHGVAEFELGTSLQTVLHTVGGGPLEDRTLRAVLSGVASPLLHREHLATPLTYEDMDAAGTGLGAAGFIVFDDRDDLVEVLHAASRFLAVESCGQCHPCKSDGLALARSLDAVRDDDVSTHDWDHFEQLRDSVTVGARCYLAHQQQRITDGARDVADMEVVDRPADPRPVLIAPVVDIVDDTAILDTSHADKQPDWSRGGEDSGQYPADRESVAVPSTET